MTVKMFLCVCAIVFLSVCASNVGGGICGLQRCFFSVLLPHFQCRTPHLGRELKRTIALRYRISHKHFLTTTIIVRLGALLSLSDKSKADFRKWARSVFVGQ